jgi:phage FluMu gp28-like protein
MACTGRKRVSERTVDEVQNILECSDSKVSSISSDTESNSSVDGVVVIDTIMNDDSDVEAEAASADSFIWGEVVSLTEL